jgi:hypothetical protein
MADPYRWYRTGFSLHWLCSRLTETTIAVYEHETQAGSFIGDDARDAVLEAARLIGSAGRWPSALASEYNIPRPTRGA